MNFRIIALLITASLIFTTLAACDAGGEDYSESPSSKVSGTSEAASDNQNGEESDLSQDESSDEEKDSSGDAEESDSSKETSSQK